MVSWLNCWTNQRLAGIQYAIVFMWRHCDDNTITFFYNTPTLQYTPDFSDLVVICGKFITYMDNVIISISIICER